MTTIDIDGDLPPEALAHAALAYDYPAHYLVGLANYPNSDVPSVFQGVTSGTAKARPEGGQTCEESNFANPWCDTEFGPWNYVPSVGFSDIEFYFNEAGQKVNDEFLCLTDNGYGSSSNSWDYPYVYLCPVHLALADPPRIVSGGAKEAARMHAFLSRIAPVLARPLLRTGCTSIARRSASRSPSATASPRSRRTRRPNPRTSSCCTTRTTTSSGRTAQTSR
jgi:hypothetical protein